MIILLALVPEVSVRIFFVFGFVILFKIVVMNMSFWDLGWPKTENLKPDILTCRLNFLCHVPLFYRVCVLQCWRIHVDADASFLSLSLSFFTDIFLQVSTQNTILRISSSTRARSLASSSQSCLSFMEYGYLGSTSTDRTLDFNLQHWTVSILEAAKEDNLFKWSEHVHIVWSITWKLLAAWWK